MNIPFLGSYERDNETGLDFAQARYYSNIYGRFTSPDEPFVDQYEYHPQSWNLYTYVRNNPLNHIDPTGRYVCKSDGTCIGQYDGERNGEMYWNKGAGQWESRKEFEFRRGPEKLKREAELALSMLEFRSRFGNSDRTGARGVATLGGTIAARPPYSPPQIAVGSLLLFGAALAYITNYDNLPPPILVNPVQSPLVNPISLTLTDKIGKIASDLGWTEEQVRKAIHKVKQNLKGGPRKNPDVSVDTSTGEVYPKNPDGTHGDSIGNIHDP